MNVVRASSLIRLLLLSLWLCAVAPVHAAPDLDAEVLFVRKSCAGWGPNCFDAIADADFWTWNTRDPAPDADSPLLWDIGPGIFAGEISCNNAGYVTFRGSGRDATRIVSQTQTVTVSNGCVDLSFRDLTLEGVVAAVFWVGNGSASWENVGLERRGTNLAYGLAWWDECLASAPGPSVHYFFGSKIVWSGKPGTNPHSGGVAAVSGQCGEIHFFSGEISMELDDPNVPSFTSVIAPLQQARFIAVGSSIRAHQSVEITSSQFPLAGVRLLSTSGDFELHGGEIQVVVDPGMSQAFGAAAIDNLAGGTVNVTNSSFTLQAGTGGQASRLLTTGGQLGAPHLWNAGPTPPGAPSEVNTLASVDGEDLFVETDCLSSGDCDGSGGNEAHLMVYNEAGCGTSDPWFDTMTGRCRNVTP